LPDGLPDGLEDAWNTDTEALLAELELPEVIGAPIPRRPNEETVWPMPGVGSGIGESADVETTGHRASPMNSPVNGPRANISVVVEDIRRRQTETRRSREEAAAQTVTRPSREIPIERLVQSRLHQRLILLTEPTAPECEQYRTLRTQLFLAAEKPQTHAAVFA